jgi:hypothetical protein
MPPSPTASSDTAAIFFISNQAGEERFYLARVEGISPASAFH